MREKLKQLRFKTGQSQKEFGNMLGVTGENQGQIEKGVRKPSARYVLNVMEKFNLNVIEAKEMFNL